MRISTKIQLILTGFLRWLEDANRRQEAMIFVLWAFWLTCLNFMGPLAYARFVDNADGVVPFHISAALHPTLWYPYQGSGVDLLAQGIFNDIDVLLFFAFPPWLACAAVMFLQRLISGIFMFRLLREDLQLRTSVALFGALEFAAFIHGFAQWSNGLGLVDMFSLPLLPAVLWLIPRIAARVRWSYIFAIGLGLLVAVSTLFVFQLLLLPLFILWFFLIAKQRSNCFWNIFAVFLIAYFAAELPSIYISAINAVGSHRAELTDSFNENITNRLLRCVDWALGYSVQIALTIAGCMCYLVERKSTDTYQLRRAFAIAFGCLMFLRLFYVFYPLIWQHIWQHLPIIRGFTIERLVFSEGFLITITACLALELLAPIMQSLRLPRNIKFSVERVATVSIALVLAHSLIAQTISFASQFSGPVGGYNFTTLYADENLLALKARTKSDPPFRVQASGEREGAWLAAYAFESAGGYLNIYPKRYQEFWAQVILPLQTGDPDRYRRFINHGNHIYLYHPPFNITLLSLANVRFIVSSAPLDVPGLEIIKAARPLVGPVRRWEDMKIHERLFSYFKNTYQGIAPYIYENKRYLPRVFSVGAVRSFESTEELLKSLSEATLESLTNSVYFNHTDAEEILNGGMLGSAQVQIISRQADEWIVTTSGDRPSVLVITNSFHRYWNAYVDGVPSKVLPAYHAFQAVAVPAGNHQITLRYEPPYRILR